MSASLERDFPGEEGMRVGHETVYRALYAQGRGSLREELVDVQYEMVRMSTGF